MLLSINPQIKGVKVQSNHTVVVKNCTVNGTYYHGTLKGGKRVISPWVKRFITRDKYNIYVHVE